MGNWRSLFLIWASAAKEACRLISQHCLSTSPAPVKLATDEKVPTIPRQLQTPPRQIAEVCGSGAALLPFEAYVLLTVLGRPSLVSEQDVTALGLGFTETYNNLLNCSLSGTSQVLDNATIVIPSPSMDISNHSYQATTTTNITSILIEEFTYLLVARGQSCTLCGANGSVLLFSNTSLSGRRQLQPIADLSNPEAITWYDAEQGAIVARKHLDESASVDQPISSSGVRILQNNLGCGCQGPNESAFTTLLNSAFFQNASQANTSGAINSTAINGIVGATQLIRTEPFAPHKVQD